jgi:hypothetical protein
MKLSNNNQISQVMKTNLIIVAFALVGMTTRSFGCSEANAVSSEIRPPQADFYGIILNGNANVYLSQGDGNSVTVQGNRENVDEVSTSVSNGMLVINSGALRNVTIYVSMTDINLLQVNGNGVINAQTTINSDMLLMKVIGDGVINADVRTLSLGTIINGNGKIYVHGITGDCLVKIKGEGKVITANLDSLRNTYSEIISANYDRKKMFQ